MESDFFYLLTKKPKPAQALARVAYTSSTAISGATIVPWNQNTLVQGGVTASSAGIIVPTTGYYKVSGAITFSSSAVTPYVAPGANAYGYAQIVAASTVVAKGTTVKIVSTTTAYTSQVSDIVYASAGATITLSAISSAGLYIWGVQDQAAVTGNFMTYLSVFYLGD